MKTRIVTTVLLMAGICIHAQTSMDGILVEIEKNNTTLMALRNSLDAEKIGNQTGLAPRDPEVAFNYLLGKPSALGNRMDFSVKQSFDFPTTYAYKRQLSALKNEQVEWAYAKQRNDILGQARKLCAELVYYNALLIELNTQQAQAQKLLEAYTAKFNAGEVSVLEYNKVQLHQIRTKKVLESKAIERKALLTELTGLNGGLALSFSDSLFTMQPIPANFEDWYARVEATDPLLQWVRQEISISEKQIKLTEAMNLPKIQTGYMSETLIGEQFRGLTLGVSIPLWEQKNTLKQAKAESKAIKSREADAVVQFYHSLKTAFSKVTALQQGVVDYRASLARFSNENLLEKAFIKGELSLTDYLYERNVYIDTRTDVLEMERTLHLAYCELIEKTTTQITRLE